MSNDYLMNIATVLYLICYVPEFYANYVNKNANIYNVFEKVALVIATGFGLGYAISIQNHAIIINYAPLFALDSIALFMRAYYAYCNRNIDVRVINIESPTSLDIQRNPLHPLDTFDTPIHIDSDL
jgi:uncharacterized protein with PQ loop repeat